MDFEFHCLQDRALLFIGQTHRTALHITQPAVGPLYILNLKASRLGWRPGREYMSMVGGNRYLTRS